MTHHVWIADIPILNRLVPMFVIKKLITPFLLPPGIFILLLALVGIWSLRRTKRRAAATYLTVGGLIWVFSAGLTANWMMGRLESNLRLPAEVDADVIIMLGGSLYSNAPDLSGTGAPGPGTMERIVTAARLNRRWAIPIVVSGGRVFKHSGSIAQVSRRFLEDLGIPSDMIIIEDRSRDTYENARFSAKICEQYGFTRPLLVTSGYHMKRALLAFEKVGLSVVPYPCALTTWPHKRLTIWHALPSASALKATSSALHEMLGSIYYSWRY